MSPQSLGALRGLVVGLVLGAPSQAHAASLTGRVVDSAGKGVAGAEVRVWQKAPGQDDSIENQLVMFGDAEFLRTDLDGRFQTPDTLAGDAFARVVVEQEGMLAARGEWIEVEENAITASPDIIVRRLVEVAGRVVDRQHRPVADVTVFNSGDGHERVETLSDAAGRFVLKGVPEGRIFLFAEKSGYRFTGMLWEKADGEPSFTLSRIDEHIKPLRTLPPLLSRVEELALAHRLLDPYLAEVQESGSESSRYVALVVLAGLDPMEAFQRAGEFHLKNPDYRWELQRSIVDGCVGRGDVHPDDLQAINESAEDEALIHYQYTVAAAQVTDRRRRLAWLDRASLHARAIEEPDSRVSTLAFVAEGLVAADDATAANLLVAEAEPTALALPNSGASAAVARADLAFALAREKPRQALGCIEGIKDDYYQRFGGKLAIRLLPREPDLAEELWNRTIERNRRPELANPWWKYPQTPDFCYLMAGIDRERAERLARRSEVEAVRLRGRAAVAEAQRETDASAGRKVLTTIVRDELPRLAADGGDSNLRSPPPVTAAWLLPIVERFDPELATECFWRALALRLPRPRRDHLDDDQAEMDGLAEMIARYDRGIARFLLEPSVARLPAFSRAAVSGGKSRHALRVSQAARGMISYVTGTAAHIDPKWAGELVQSLPKNSGESQFSPRNEALFPVMRTLSLVADDRWTSPNAGSTGFWRPPQK